MKKSYLSITCFFVFLLLATCNESSLPVTSKEGKLVTIGKLPVLFLKGNHYDRGYQQGAILGSGITEVFNEFILKYVCKENDSIYDHARKFLLKHLVYEDKYRTEAGAMIQGMQAKGTDLYNQYLNRQLDSLDILVLNSIEELFNVVKDSTYGCSSISSWHEATTADSILKGELVITRHWDYFVVQGLIKHLLMIVHQPSEPDEQRWISCAWAGMIGSCSAINEKGVGAFLDYGAFFWEQEEYPNLSEHRSICLSIRNAIEHRNYDGQGTATSADVIHAVQEYTPFFGSLIHVVMSSVVDTPALIIESDNARGVTIRIKDDNTAVLGDNLAITNHFRLLYPPEQCWRYQNIVDSLQTSTNITMERSWDLLAGAGAAPGCLISFTYVPFLGSIRCSFAQAGPDTIPAYDIPSTTVSLDSLFKL